MQRFAAALIGIGLAVAWTIAPATTASADPNVCAPITVDGAPLCVDLGIVLGPATLIAQEETSCSGAANGPTGVYVGAPTLEGFCEGVGVWVQVSGPSVATNSTPVHVPQICLTTTNTCVGGVDEYVPTPSVTGTPSVLMCVYGGAYAPGLPPWEFTFGAPVGAPVCA